MILPPLRLPRRLQAVPDPGPHQTHAGALAVDPVEGGGLYRSPYVGDIVAVRYRGTLVAGRLKSITDSVDKPLLVFRIGMTSVAIHPAQLITVAPADYTLSVHATPPVDAGAPARVDKPPEEIHQ